jgi:hypothetical protein
MMVTHNMELAIGQQTFQQVRFAGFMRVEGSSASAQGLRLLRAADLPAGGTGFSIEGLKTTLSASNAHPAADRTCRQLHVLCVPSPTSLCQQVVQDAVREHALLPPHHRAVQMVKHVGMRIAQVRQAMQREGLCVRAQGGTASGCSVEGTRLGQRPFLRRTHTCSSQRVKPLIFEKLGEAPNLRSTVRLTFLLNPARLPRTVAGAATHSTCATLTGSLLWLSRQKSTRLSSLVARWWCTQVGAAELVCTLSAHLHC